MSHSTGVDVHALLDVVEEELMARLFEALCEFADLPGGPAGALGDLRGKLEKRPSGAAPSPSPASSALAACRASRSRSRSPVRAAPRGALRPASRRAGRGSDLLPVDRAPLEEWKGQFDGRVRTMHHGFVLTVDDAQLNDGRLRRRSVFVDAYGGNRVLRGEVILAHCLARHLDGRLWDHVMELCDSLRQIARAELDWGPAGACAMLCD